MCSYPLRWNIDTMYMVVQSYQAKKWSAEACATYTPVLLIISISWYHAYAIVIISMHVSWHHAALIIRFTTCDIKFTKVQSLNKNQGEEICNNVGKWW